MKKRKLLSFLLVFATAVALSASGSSAKAAEETTAEETEAEAEAGSDRYLVWRLSAEPKLWDPTNNSESISDAIVKQLFEGLTVSTADGFKPGMAESWDVSEDGKTYTFHLRKDGKWSDGDPVTAKDFEYSWRRICDPSFASEALQGVTDYVVGAQEYFDGTGSYASLNPRMTVSDIIGEPISALDVSIQAQVVNMLEDLQASLGLTYLFIAHDLSMVRHISKKVGVTYLGSLVEFAETEELYTHTLHPYTKALLSAVPELDPAISKTKRVQMLTGEIPSPINTPPGCKFATRCPHATPRCKEERPEFKEVCPGHYAACHLV